jgi:hypothetical protein
MWTHGYDVYTPPQSVVFHDYDAANKKKYDPREWINMGMVRQIICALKSRRLSVNELTQTTDFIRMEHDASHRRMYTVLGAQISVSQLIRRLLCIEYLHM